MMFPMNQVCVVLALFAFNQVTPDTPTKLKRFEFTETHMGAPFRIVLYASNDEAAKKAAKAAYARVAELNGIMSDYQPTSELMKLCEKAGGEPVGVSADLFEVLQQSEQFAKITGGAFDVSIGPLSRLWRKARRTGELPAEDAIAKAGVLVDYRKIKLNPKDRTVQLLLPGMQHDLGGIGKGYAADAALAVLKRHGISRAMVAAGGDIAVGDAPPDALAWKIGIAPLKNPDAEATHYLALKNASVSTAGDAEQFLEFKGKRYSHIIDPKTGYGVTGRRSVTVIASNATTSDGLDTGLCVLGIERGLNVVERLPGIAALFVFGGETKESARFKSYLWP
jgi:thiamine biosynthesis lipoprotein